MRIIFQKKEFNIEKEVNFVSIRNNSVGSVISFVGKVRPINNGKKLRNIEISCYKKMASFQTKKIVTKFIDNKKIDDYLVIHRFGVLKPSENIVIILVASKHRKEGFEFVDEVIKWFKTRITFWKKENYMNGGDWLEKQN